MHSAKDGFAVNAEYIGRGLLSKMVLEEEEQSQKTAVDCRDENDDGGNDGIFIYSERRSN